MVGLSTAWFLQEQGIDVTVVDRKGVAAGSSWGNAGWLTPGLAIPLPDPAVLSYGLRALLRPSSPVYVAPTLSPRLITFLLQFLGNSTAERWQQGMAHLVPVNGLALESFDALAAGGVTGRTKPTDDFVAGFRTADDRRALLDELRHIEAAGQEIDFAELSGDEVRQIVPALSEQIGAGIRLRGQRFVDPGDFVHRLGESVVARGGTLVAGHDVVDVVDVQGKVVVRAEDGELGRFDAAVLASGAWLGRLARRHGVTKIVQAGRGYSFSVAMDEVPSGPVYLPTQRVACTPLGDRLRVAGMMEFRSPDAALDARRVKAIVDATRPLLRGVDFDDRRDTWVGSRPCTSDGLPIIGATKTPNVYVAGGHGMWGITLGPATGRLLAEQIASGARPAVLEPFDPLR